MGVAAQALLLTYPLTVKLEVTKDSTLPPLVMYYTRLAMKAKNPSSLTYIPHFNNAQNLPNSQFQAQ
jgi:hypothetical protein